MFTYPLFLSPYAIFDPLLPRGASKELSSESPVWLGKISFDLVIWGLSLEPTQYFGPTTPLCFNSNKGIISDCSVEEVSEPVGMQLLIEWHGEGPNACPP